MNHITPAEKKKQEERQQWMILGISMGVLLLSIGGFFSYVLLKQKGSKQHRSVAKKPASSKQIAKRQHQPSPRMPDAPLPAADEPDPDIYSDSLDDKSIAKASEYKNRHSAGRLHSSRVNCRVHHIPPKSKIAGKGMLGSKCAKQKRVATPPPNNRSATQKGRIGLTPY